MRGRAPSAADAATTGPAAKGEIGRPWLGPAEQGEGGSVLLRVCRHVSRAVWRQRDFGLLWGGQTVSEIGSAVTTLALPPLAIFAFHAGPAAVGLMVASERVPFPIVALFAGAIVDRVRRRPVLVACNLARLAILPATPTPSP